MHVPCGCDNRKAVMGQGTKIDVSILIIAFLLLGLTKGGTVTSTTQKLLVTALMGALSALAIDALVKPGVHKLVK